MERMEKCIMENFINGKLGMLFICKDDKAMYKRACQVEHELMHLCPSGEQLDMFMTTYEEMTDGKGYLKGIINTERLDEVAKITIVTWFGVYTFYSMENGYTGLRGVREDVVVLDDEIEFDKEKFKDCIEPIASFYGDMILSSKFTQCPSRTKYTRQLHHGAKQTHADLIYNHLNK